MKRLFSAFAIVLLMIGMAECTYAEEILFRGIPWGSSLQDVRKALENDGYKGLSTNEAYGLFWNQYYKSLSQTDYGWVSSDRMTDNVCGWLLDYTNLGFENAPKVAGYEVMYLYTYYLYCADDETTKRTKEDSILYRALYVPDAADYNNAFIEISEKMHELYGEWTVITRDSISWENGKQINNIIESRYFQGDNGTYVVLEIERQEGVGLYLTITYGTDKFDDYIIKLDKMIYQEDMQKKLEEENKTDRTGDYTGL